jgi:tetratricopeptide (TPR) repeat protein
VAEQHLRHAVDLSLRNAMFHVYLGMFLAARHLVEEAEAGTAKARELDPLSPFVHALGAVSMFTARKYEAAIRLGERALELQSDYPIGLLCLGWACCKLDSYEHAIEVLERLILISKRTPLFLGTLGMAYALAGRRLDALTLREELLRRRHDEYVVPHNLLAIDLALGDWDEIYEDLQACIADQVTGFSLELVVGPFLDPLDAELRFNETFRRLRLVQPRPGT